MLKYESEFLKLQLSTHYITLFLRRLKGIHSENVKKPNSVASRKTRTHRERETFWEADIFNSKNNVGQLENAKISNSLSKGMQGNS